MGEDKRSATDASADKPVFEIGKYILHYSVRVATVVNGPYTRVLR